eukprot:scaffold5992_cov78-Skeletonema_marinoi.AAC.7
MLDVQASPNPKEEENESVNDDKMTIICPMSGLPAPMRLPTAATSRGTTASSAVLLLPLCFSSQLWQVLAVHTAAKNRVVMAQQKIGGASKSSNGNVNKRSTRDCRRKKHLTRERSQEIDERRRKQLIREL